MKRTTAAILIAIMLLFSLAVPVLAQGYQFLCTVFTTPDGNWSMSCVPFVPTPAPTATVQPTATATAIPATATATVVPPTATTQPTPTATMVHEHPTPAPTVPTATATSPVSPLPTPVPTATGPVSPLPTPPPAPTTNPGPIAMYPGAPKCPSHDPAIWHSIWDSARGCYYDHEHGDDPASANDIFGPIEKYTGGQMMLAWHQPFEHEVGAHGGWKFEVNRELPRSGCITGDCIVASRTLSHNGPKGAYRGTHTYLAQYLIQSPDGTRSMISTGGAWVLPVLRSPYVEQTVYSDGVPLASLNEWQTLPGYGYARQSQSSSDPYRNHSACREALASLALGEPQNKARETINATNTIIRFWIMADDAPNADGGHLYGQNPWASMSTTVLDASSCVYGTVDGIQSEPFVHELAPAQCPLLPNGAIGCRFNNSFRTLFSAEVEMGWRTAWLDNSKFDRDSRRGWLDIDTYIKPQLRNADGSLIIGRPDPRRHLTEATTCAAYGPGCAPLVYKGRVVFAQFETPVGNGSWQSRNYDNPYPGVWWLGPGN